MGKTLSEHIIGAVGLGLLSSSLILGNFNSDNYKIKKENSKEQKEPYVPKRLSPRMTSTGIFLGCIGLGYFGRRELQLFFEFDDEHLKE